jgi:hypothetical protein
LKEQLDIIKKSIQNSGINVSVPLEEVERYKQEIVRMKLENDKLMKSNSEHDIRMQRLQTVSQISFYFLSHLAVRNRKLL